MATTSGLFGNKPAGSGLFGASSTATPTATGGALFRNAAATTNTGTGAAAGTGGGLFNAASSTTPAASTTTGPTATTGTSGTTLGLFSNAASSTQQPAQQQTTGGGGSLFGSAATTTSTFGGATTTTAPAATASSLFGQAAPAAQQKPATSLFGQQPTAQPATQVAAVQINYDSLRPRSRFDDLAQPVQNEIDLIDKGIQRVTKMRDEIGQFMPQHEKDIEQLGRDVQFVESKFKTVQDALNRDIQTVKVLQDMTKKNIADGQLSFKAADNLKLPTHYHQTGLFAGTAPADPNSGDASSAHANAQDLITYFNRICDDVEKYKKRLDEYRSQIERDMPGVENGLYEQIRSLRDRSSSAPIQDQLNQVLLALRETGNAVVAQAGVIAETRERLSRLQAGYLDGGLYGSLLSS